MNERRTMSMLQRVPVILAVTAASYGLPVQAQSAAQRSAGKAVISRPAAISNHAAPQARFAAQY